MDIKKEYERWLVNATVDADIVDELKTLDDTKIEDAFYRDLAFGTGGLRGVIDVYKRQDGALRTRFLRIQKCRE